MKVLWFTNTSCSLAKKIYGESYSGGWMEALENALNKIPGIELHISFYHDKVFDAIEYNNSKYYPVLRAKSYLTEIKRRILHDFFNDAEEIERLKKIIEQVNPDIIHIHGTEDNFGLIQSIVKKPVIISIQGIINPYYEKYYSGISMQDVKNNEPLKSKLKFATQFKSYLRFKSMAIREARILEMSKHIAGRTDWDRRVTSVLAKKASYHHVDELLRADFNNFEWKLDNIRNNEFKIVTTTSNSIYKGFETIVKTAKLLRQYLGDKFSWHIIGLSENDAVVKITVSLLKANLSELNIVLHGRKLPEKFIPVMLDSHVFCQTSHIENSPNSVCEAMLIGMPVVASFAGGTESLLENYKEGLLIQEGDPFSLAGVLVELKNNPEKSKLLGKFARIRAVERHNPTKVVNKLVKVYEQILNEEN